MKQAATSPKPAAPKRIISRSQNQMKVPMSIVFPVGPTYCQDQYIKEAKTTTAQIITTISPSILRRLQPGPSVFSWLSIWLIAPYRSAVRRAAAESSNKLNNLCLGFASHFCACGCNNESIQSPRRVDFKTVKGTFVNI